MDNLLIPPSGRDYFLVNGASLISDVDFVTVTRLYQPIIGYKACMVYFTLVDYINKFEGELVPHKELFEYMQISPSDYLVARRALEAVCLLKSYVSESKELTKYTYVIYSPKTPKDFFSDVLFKGLLVNYIGEKNATKLASLYKCKMDLLDAKNVSAQFMDVFQPNLDDDSFNTEINVNLKDNKVLKVDTNFSYDDFFTHLKLTSNILKTAFSKKELDEIERISTLYGLDIITACDITSQCFDYSKKVGSKVDLKMFMERAINEAKFITIARKASEKKTYIKISGHTEVANDIDLMEKLSPRLYLQNRQDGAPPVTADLKLFDYLSSIMKLSNGAINALVSYCLKNCDNRLDKNYVEKVASSLKREKITSALDAINYLENRTGKTKSSKVNKTNYKETKSNDEFDIDEYNALLEKAMKK